MTETPAGTNFGRDEAWQLLTEWTRGDSLRKHAIAVEICLTACGEDEADRLALSGDERELMAYVSTHTIDGREDSCSVFFRANRQGQGR